MTGRYKLLVAAPASTPNAPASGPVDAEEPPPEAEADLADDGGSDGEEDAPFDVAQLDEYASPQPADDHDVAPDSVAGPADPAIEPDAADEPAAGTVTVAGAEWYRDPSGRFVVGDPGAQLGVVPRISRFADRPDTVIDGATIGSVIFRAASLRGLGHQQSGKTRQDAFGVRASANQAWLVGTVADGVSSGPRSHEAADIAVARITASLASALDDVAVPADSLAWGQLALGLPWQAAVDDASNAIMAEVSGQVRAAFIRQGQLDRVEEMDRDGMPVGAATRVMATTAIAFVIATGPNDGGALPFAVLPAAGDSSAFVLVDRGWHALTAIKNQDADIASSAVRPLPGQYDVEPVVDVLAPGEALVVITDGIGDPLGAGNSAVGRFLAAAWAAPTDVLEFAHHVGFLRRTFVDDRTALVAWNVA